MLVRTKLSEAAAATLAEELGAKELEEQAWVEMELIVEQMGVGGKGKLRGKKGEAEEEEGGGEGEGDEGGDAKVEGGKKVRDMSV